MLPPFRTLIVTALAGLGVCACNAPSSSATWPTQSVRLIVPFTTGTGVDLAARLFAARLAERWKQAVVVDNRPGGDGLVGTQAFVTAKDPHTLLFAAAGAVTFAPYLHERLPYDPLVDTVPISAVGSVTLAFAVSTAVEASSLADLVAIVKQHPDKYLWTSSPGGPELVVRAFNELETLRMTHVRYRDTSIALQDLGAGRVHVMLASLATVSPQVQAGAARLLAVTNTGRSPAAPLVPTVAEAGYPILTVDGLWGLFGWRGMPDDLRRRIAADTVAVAADRALAERLSAVGLFVRSGTPEEFAAALDQQRKQVATFAQLATRSR